MLLAGVAFILHLFWETLHLPLYTNYSALSGPLPITLYATLGDVLYTLGAVLGIGFLKQDIDWLRRARALDYATLTVVGFATALFVEYKALALHRWAYTAAMPTIFGVGLSPLLQMTLLLPLSVYAAQLLARRLAKH